MEVSKDVRHPETGQIKHKKERKKERKKKRRERERSRERERLREIEHVKTVLN